MPFLSRTRLGLAAVGVSLAALYSFACGSSDAGSGPSPSSPSDGNDSGAPPSGRDAGSNDGPFGSNDGGDEPVDPDACPEDAKLVYTIDLQNTLHKFDPKTATFTTVGKIHCDSSVLPNSMGVDRTGTAWVLYSDGSLFKVSTKDASCQSTTFEPGQLGFSVFGMGFATDGPNSKTERLYIADAPPEQHLGVIDLTTLKVSDIGPVTGLSARAELTGTGAGKLFGAFEGTPFVIAEIDKSSGNLFSKSPQSNVAGENSNFAFAAWGGSFWLFVGNDVFQNDPTAHDTKKVATVNFRVVGAGVSTCAPTEPPK